jgi:hypothetical protein
LKPTAAQVFKSLRTDVPRDTFSEFEKPNKPLIVQQQMNQQMNMLSPQVMINNL